jgi:hypothetical protein
MFSSHQLIRIQKNTLQFKKEEFSCAKMMERKVEEEFTPIMLQTEFYLEYFQEKVTNGVRI